MCIRQNNHMIKFLSIQRIKMTHPQATVTVQIKALVKGARKISKCNNHHHYLLCRGEKWWPPTERGRSPHCADARHYRRDRRQCRALTPTFRRNILCVKLNYTLTWFGLINRPTGRSTNRRPTLWHTVCCGTLHDIQNIRLRRSKTHPAHSTLLCLASQLLISAATPRQPSPNTIRRCHVRPHCYLIYGHKSNLQMRGSALDESGCGQGQVAGPFENGNVPCFTATVLTQALSQLASLQSNVRLPLDQCTAGCQHNSEWHSNVPLYDGDRITTLRRVTQRTRHQAPGPTCVEQRLSETAGCVRNIAEGTTVATNGSRTEGLQSFNWKCCPENSWHLPLKPSGHYMYQKV